MARKPRHVRSMVKRLKHKPSSKDYHSIESKLHINNLMKKNLRQLWVANYTHDPDLLVTMEGRVSEAWRKLTPHQIYSGFRKTNLLVKESHSMVIEYELEPFGFCFSIFYYIIISSFSEKYCYRELYNCYFFSEDF